MQLKHSIVGFALIGLVGCQTISPPSSSNAPKIPEAPKKTEPSSEGIKITPYDRPEIKREKIPVIVQPQKKVQQKFDDGRQLPAFKLLMQKTQTAFKQGKWNEAEQTAMQAQRLAPQSSETFMYLALIANNKNQPKNAESLARRGLSYAQSDTMKRQLWQIILKSGQMMNNKNIIQEAQTRLKSI